MPGKKPRLVGDGTVSGANRRRRLSEKIRVPSLESVQRFVSLVPESTALCALSFDVRGAHKLVRVHPREQGYSTFVCLKTPGMCIELVISVRVGVHIGLGV